MVRSRLVTSFGTPEPPGEGWLDSAIEVAVSEIESSLSFAQVAYRDGEWYCLLGASGENVNGEKYSPALAAKLRETLREPVGQRCVFWDPAPVIGRKAHADALAWMARNPLRVEWLPDCPIRKANEIGLAAPIWRAVAGRRTIVVGPGHFRSLDLFQPEARIEVPPRYAWTEAPRIVDEIEQVFRPGDLVLIAAGMATNLIVHALWPRVAGSATLIDIGSALDPYCGVFSRAVYRSPLWPILQEDNRP